MQLICTQIKVDRISVLFGTAILNKIQGSSDCDYKYQDSQARVWLILDSFDPLQNPARNDDCMPRDKHHGQTSDVIAVAEL